MFTQPTPVLSLGSDLRSSSLSSQPHCKEFLTKQKLFLAPAIFICEVQANWKGAGKALLTVFLVVTCRWLALYLAVLFPIGVEGFSPSILCCVAFLGHKSVSLTSKIFSVLCDLGSSLLLCCSLSSLGAGIEETGLEDILSQIPLYPPILTIISVIILNFLSTSLIFL